MVYTLKLEAAGSSESLVLSARIHGVIPKKTARNFKTCTVASCGYQRASVYNGIHWRVLPSLSVYMNSLGDLQPLYSAADTYGCLARTRWCVLPSGCTVRRHIVVKNAWLKSLLTVYFIHYYFIVGWWIRVLWGLKLKQFWEPSFRKRI